MSLNALPAWARPTVCYNADTATIEFRIPLADGTGDHVLATLPATPPPGDEPE
jgi:hypothetical protein